MKRCDREALIHALKAVFIWLLYHFSKEFIKGAISAVDGGEQINASDAFGICAVRIFTKAELLYRKSSMIDILMARMRKKCPVLFGFRGNEGTETGRRSLGWSKFKAEKGGNWATELDHINQTFGLASTYAAICLRDFSKASVRAPFEPWHYWQTMASILSTPPKDMSNTQCTALIAMIRGHEAKFATLYGNAAFAALRIALVDVPARALKQNEVAARVLHTHRDRLQRETGLNLH